MTDTNKTPSEHLQYIRVRLAQIASGDYRACGHMAEDVAKDALPSLEALIESLKPKAPPAVDDIHTVAARDEPLTPEERERAVADAYYNGFHNLPESMRKKLSLYDLREIYDCMAKPALEAAGFVVRRG